MGSNERDGASPGERPWRWEPIAFVPVPATGFPWMHSHCQLPVGVPLSRETARVFFASRTREQRSHVGFVDLRLTPPSGVEVVGVSESPALAPGPPGTFDEHGVYPSSVVEHDGVFYLYYIGWIQGVEAPMFYASIGLAVSRDARTFARASAAPILSRSEHDPCLVTSPHVYRDNGRWRMTYVSGFRWDREPQSGRLRSFYDIKIAEGDGPAAWERRGRTAVPLAPGERNIARSWVVKVGPHDYRMWYSFVPAGASGYRIGFARSADGDAWVRADADAGIEPSSAHTADMICYPSVFSTGGYEYLLYNGNGFGRDGFGIAVRRREEPA